MDKKTALDTIDKLNRKLLDPTDMLGLVHIRVIILQIPDEDWEKYREQAMEILSQ